jgi:hypothetical protein
MRFAQHIYYISERTTIGKSDLHTATSDFRVKHKEKKLIMRKTKRSLIVGITIATLGLPIASWADNDDRANFSTATGTLHIPKLNIDGVNVLNSVEVKFDFATQQFFIEGFTPVPTSPIALEELDDNSYRFNAIAGQSYVVELFNVPRDWEEISGYNCNNSSGKGVGLVISDSSSAEIATQCKRQGFGNVHNSMKFDVGVGGEIQIDAIPSKKDVDISGKFSIRLQAEHDDPSVAWDAHFEPNNQAVNAYPIGIGAQNALTSQIEERNISFGTSQADFDWYHFDATAGQHYLIEIFNVIRLLETESGYNCGGGNYGVGLKITDSLFTEIESVCKPSGTGNVHNRIQFKAGIGGVFHIGVIPNSPTAFGTYSIRVLPFHDDPLASWDANTFEPNNAPINAFLIAPSEVITSQIEERNASYATNSSDVDYYRFEAEANQSYRVELFDVASLLSTERGYNCDGGNKGVGLKVLDSMFVQVGIQCRPTEEGNIHNSLEFRTGFSGTYYIGVIPNPDNAYGTYSLRLSKI